MASSPDTPLPAGRPPGTQPDWLVEAYRAHAGELLGFAVRALRDEAMAEDAVQETLEVDLSEPGTYEWYCPVGDHAAQGMEGEITVE